MAKSRRKSNGVQRGKFKRKKMGKGWAKHREVHGRPKPVDRSRSGSSSGEKA